MSDILKDKVKSTPFICGLMYTLKKDVLPGHGSGGGFNDTLLLNDIASDIYASISSIRFSQETRLTKAGYKYTQKLNFQFPNGDLEKDHRLEEVLRAMNFIIKLTNGSYIIIGRNDYSQNARPIITIKNNTQVTQVNCKTTSIYAIGNYNDLSGELLPAFFPI